MKLNKLSMAFIALTAISSNVYAGEYSFGFPATGWSSPTGQTTLTTSTAYDYGSQVYVTNWGVEHAGVDVVAGLDSNVYAIGPGKVLAVIRKTVSTKNNSVVTIQHQTNNGTTFCAIYGHVLSTLNVGNPVSQGQPIGTIVNGGTPVHIHFGVNTSVSSNACKGGNPPSGWGTVPKGSNLATYGFVNPFNWLTQNSPLITKDPILGAPANHSTGNSWPTLSFSWKNNNSTSVISSVEFTLREADRDNGTAGAYVGTCGSSGRGKSIGIKESYSSSSCGASLKRNQWYKWAITLYFNNGSSAKGFSAYFQTRN